MNPKLEPIIMNSHFDANYEIDTPTNLTLTNQAETNSESNTNSHSYITLIKNSSFINKGLSFVEKFKMGSMLSEMNATNKLPVSEEHAREFPHHPSPQQQQQQEVTKSSILSRSADLQTGIRDVSFIDHSILKQTESSLKHENSVKNKKLFLSNESIRDNEAMRSMRKKCSPSKTVRRPHSGDKMNIISHSKTIHGCRDIAQISLEAAPKSTISSSSINDVSRVTPKSMNKIKSGISNVSNCQYDNCPILRDNDHPYGRFHDDFMESSKRQQYDALNENTNLKIPTVRSIVSTTPSHEVYYSQHDNPYSKYRNNVDEFNHLSRSCNSVLYHSPRQGNYYKMTDAERSNKLLDELHRLYIQLKEVENQITERDSYIRYLQSILFRRDQLIQQLIKQIPESYIPEEYYESINELEGYTKAFPPECHKATLQMYRKGVKHYDKSNVLSQNASKRWNQEQVANYKNNRTSYLKANLSGFTERHGNGPGEVSQTTDAKLITPNTVNTTNNSPIINSNSHNKCDLPFSKLQYSKSGTLINLNNTEEYNAGDVTDSKITDDNKTPVIGMNLQIISKSRVKRYAISGESEKYLPPPTSHLSNWPKIEKPAHTKTLITQAILNNDFMKHLDKRQISKIVDSMCPLRCARLSWIIQEGEVGSVVYVLEDGYVEVQKAGERLREMGPGTVFGELAILYNCTRTASVRAITDCKLWAIDRPCFQSIMMFTGIQKQTEYVKFLKSVPTFKDLSLEVLGKVAVVLGSEHYEPDEYVIREGERGNTFYIITGGKVKVTKNCNSECSEQFIRYMTRGDWFGEKALTDEDVRTANIIAMPPRGVDCLMLDRDSYNVLIKDLVSFERSYPDEKPTIR
ncbi:unnamed protein product [Schistosoma turkestanicum]|nr:unnamed protein product [Schistosoma turkestanicum]